MARIELVEGVFLKASGFKKFSRKTVSINILQKIELISLLFSSFFFFIFGFSFHFCSF